MNIEGTKRVVSACVKAGSVTSIVYTSTTGVVWTGKPVRGATEDEIPLVTKEWDTYGYTKAIAEKIIIDANGQNGMRTVALRPCGMVGYEGVLFVAPLFCWVFDATHTSVIQGKRPAGNVENC